MQKIKEIKSCINEAWGQATALMLCFLAFVCVFGLMPDENLFWAKCRITEWAVIAYFVFFYIRNVWIKVFVLWCLARMITVSLTLPQAAGAASFLHFYYIFLFAMLYQFLSDCIEKRHARIILNGLCCIAIFQTIFIFFQHFKMDPIFKGLIGKASYESMDVKDLVVGTWAHTNIAGSYIGASIPLFFRRKWLAFVPFMLVALFWTRSWGAIIACAAGVIFWAMFMLPNKTKIYFVLATMALTLLYGSTFERRQFNPLKSDRMHYMKISMEMIKIRPFIGWGPGLYKSASYSIEKKYFNPSAKKSHAHFDFVEHLVETGIVGAIPVIGFIFWILYVFMRHINAASAAVMAGAFVLLVNSCSTFIFHTPLAWIFLIYIIIIIKQGERDAYQVHGA